VALLANEELMMSERDMWKLLHLLHVRGRPGLSSTALHKAGITCQPDTIDPLVYSGAVEHRQISGRRSSEYFLSQAAQSILQHTVVANKRNVGGDLRVDEPCVFVIMPFSEKWSSQIYAQLIKPAVEGAKLKCIRGDKTVRVGDLASNIWSELLKAGLVLADVTVPNVNVFYELGLAHALGKDVLLLKKTGEPLAADFGGAHYYEYSPTRLAPARTALSRAIKKWASENKSLIVGKT
jgi:hypothetical protein